MKKMIFALLILMGAAGIYGAYVSAEPVINTMKRSDYVEAKITNTQIVNGILVSYEAVHAGEAIQVQGRNLTGKVGDTVELYVLKGTHHGLPLASMRISEFAWVSFALGMFSLLAGVIGLCLNLKRKG